MPLDAIVPGGSIVIHNNAPGCNSQAEVEAACVWIGIPDVNFESEFSIYPNPAKDNLIISCTNGATIEEVVIYNQTGQKVFVKERINNSIDVSSLPPGLYFIHLQLGDQIKIRKIIKR
jgi:hypothetical protein